MTTPVLVTGGTGTLGRAVAQRLRDAGASVTVLSRHPREATGGIRYLAGDLSTGEGIEAAVRSAEVIVHCAGSSKGDEQKTRMLASAAKDARHIVLISVVGADRIPQASAIDRMFFGYFGMKLATEQVVEQSGIGWSTLRATQFHDLILMVARALARLPVIPALTGARFQPVDATEVAERMAGLALGAPSGLVPTWQARRSTLWPSWSRATSARSVSGARWSRCTFQARPPRRSGPGRTWPPIELSASGPGRSSWPIGSSRHLGRPACSANRTGGCAGYGTGPDGFGNGVVRPKVTPRRLAG
jgi:uncharacterized protein YbjT (DUF2867 family)